MKKILYIICAVLAIGLISCVKDEVYQGPPSIGDIEFTQGAIAPDAEVTVKAKITSLDGIESVNLFYKVNNGEFTKAAMTGTDGVYTGMIPGQADAASVIFYLEATSTAGQVGKSAELNYVVGADPIRYEDLVLNEINGNDKFIEIYNKGETTVSLEGVYIEKDGKIVWTGLAGYEAGAKSYLVLYTDREKPNMPEWDENLFFEGGLSASKNVRVQLFSPASSLDDFNLTGFTAPAAASYSRYPNGEGAWVFAAATPGAKNDTGGDAVPGLE